MTNTPENLPPKAKGGSERKTLTIEEAGQLLGISRNPAYAAAQRGEIPTIRIGRRLLVPKAALNAMLGLRPTVPEKE